MNEKQFNRMKQAAGFIAALDQSGGSTPKALKSYGIESDQFSNDEEMYTLVHEMRTRIIKSSAFSSEHILGAILFENTMDRRIDGTLTADYLWQEKGVVPFLKIDKGLDVLQDGVQLMKPIPDLAYLLKHAVERNIFGTKERSVIQAANPEGIKKVVAQQFDLAKQVFAAGLIPIVEPEVDIHSQDKKESEAILKTEITKQLDALTNEKVILKLSIPSVDNFYEEFTHHPKILRVVALSGGYSREDADEKLAKNHGVIASFSRALSEGLFAQQSDEAFNQILANSIAEIYAASVK